jgi:glutathione synthase/RimK-type ligase-like ATP-grasp enzyme
MRVLGEIDASGAVLVNDLSLVRWNLAKTYLRELESRGALIVPSRWYECAVDAWFERGGLEECFRAFGDKVIVKPVVGSNATDTFLLSRPLDARKIAQLQETFRARPFVVQQFIDTVCNEGEYSLFYLGDRYSHAIRKVPGSGDFRVQEEYGAEISSVEPEAALRETADSIMRLLDPLPVYCRSDFVRGEKGTFLLMELEMIEPSMYLRTNSAAARRFAESLDRYVRQRAAATSQESVWRAS